MVQPILEGSIPPEKEDKLPLAATPFPFPLAGGSVVEAVFGLLANVVPVFPLLFQQFFQFIVNYQSSSSVSFFGMVFNFSSCGFLYNSSEVTSGPLSHPKILLP